MDITTYALSKKIAAHAVSGVQSMSVSGQTLTINTKDSGVLTMTFPTPKDGVSVTDIDVNANNQIVFTMSDGSEVISGKIPTVKGDKGDPGFSPTITENADNTDKIYKLDITTADSTFTTPNLKGADGQGGTGGSGEENTIDSISVNGVNVVPDENKNVDITVPNIYVGDTEPIDDNMEVWFNPNGESSSIDVPIEKIKVNGELQIPVNKVVDIIVPDSGEGTAETTTYTNADYPSYTNVDLALDALFSKVYYVKPTCSLSATPRGGTFEMGTVISAPITFTWTTNKAITSQTLTGCTLADANVRTATYNTNITSDKTFTLFVSDGENSASSSVSYKFLNNIFWGSAAAAETYDSVFIRALSNKKLASAVKGTYSFNIANGEYGFWAVPSNMTISSVWIGGFEVTVDDLGTVSYTNAQGYTRDYKLYKTGKSGLGSISAEIK